MARPTIHGEGHGENKTPEYRIWSGMKERCYRIDAAHYEDYGGRGIRVCERWRNSFLNFLADMGRRPPGRNGKRPKYWLERRNNDGDYEPNNCYWATASQQARNRRNSKLSSEQADRIRALAKEGNLSQEKIAAMFGVRRPCISKILLGQRHRKENEQ